MERKIASRSGEKIDWDRRGKCRLVVGETSRLGVAKKTTGTAEEIGDRSQRKVKRAAERLKQSQCCRCFWKTPLNGYLSLWDKRLFLSSYFLSYVNIPQR